MAQIKIVRIIGRLNIGGPAVNASLLSSSLDSNIFHTKVIYGSLAEGEGDLSYLMKNGNVDMELVPELGRELSPLNDLRAFAKIVRILRAERPDIVHTHTAKAGTVGRIAAVVSGVKIRIHTFHGNVFKHYFSRAKTSIFIFVERVLALFTTRIIAVSPKQKEELVSEFKIVPRQKCEVVPLGIDIAGLKDACMAGSDLRREMGLQDVFTVGILGRLSEVKNHKMFISAAAEVRKERPDLRIKYLIVGDGTMKDELKKLSVSLAVDDIVDFLGWRKDLGPIYKALDVVALTSLNEGTPLALIEAMAMAKAILATDVGGVPDIIDDGLNGLLVKPGDIQAFVKSLIRLLEDEGLRKRLAEAALKKSAVFSKENLVSCMSKLYLDCYNEEKYI